MTTKKIVCAVRNKLNAKKEILFLKRNITINRVKNPKNLYVSSKDKILIKLGEKVLKGSINIEKYEYFLMELSEALKIINAQNENRVRIISEINRQNQIQSEILSEIVSSKSTEFQDRVIKQGEAPKDIIKGIIYSAIRDYNKKLKEADWK